MKEKNSKEEWRQKWKAKTTTTKKWQLNLSPREELRDEIQEAWGQTQSVYNLRATGNLRAQAGNYISISVSISNTFL